MKNIKAVGLATMLVLALAAFLGASTASANWFKAGQSGATLQGSREGSNHNLMLGLETFKCKNVSFTGSMTSTTEASVTTSPELASCAVGGAPGGTTWSTNGCKFRFNAGKGSSLKGTVDIINCTSPMSVSYAGFCKVEIGNQKGLGTVEYANVNEGKEFTATAHLTSITYTRQGGGYCESAFNGTFNNGVYEGTWRVKGSVSGVSTPVFVESTSPAPNTVFAAEEAPVTITGSNNVNQKRLSAGGSGSVTCANYTLSGVSSSASTSALTLAPGFSSCTWGAWAISNEYITGGGCSYVHHVNGTFDIAGASCEQEPIMVTRPGCVLTIGPQSGLSMESASPYTNEGSGKLRKISMVTGVIGGVTYTLYGPGCNGEGTFSNGSVRDTALLSATNSSGGAQGISVE